MVTLQRIIFIVVYQDNLKFEYNVLYHIVHHLINRFLVRSKNTFHSCFTYLSYI